jgi:RsiW-degrading membrane proteinase PrsW (M82 family)
VIAVLLLFILAIYLLIVWGTFSIAKSKRRNPWFWSVLAVFVTWVALLFIAIMPPAPISVVAPASPQSSSDKESIAERMQKLAELHAAGIITDDEFATKRTELLGRL